MKEKYGVFFGMGKATEEELKDLESRVVKITPEMEDLEVVKIVRQAQKDNPNVRVELIKETNTHII